ncbi:uncharacterized protein LOC144132708 [Amblyomma americanum]
MAESQKLKQLKAVLAKKATADWVNSLHQSIGDASDIAVTSATSTSSRFVGPAQQQRSGGADSHSSLGPQEFNPQLASNATGCDQSSLASLTVPDMSQPSDAKPCGLSKLERLRAAIGSSSSVPPVCHTTRAKQCSLSKLDRLKAVLEESKRKNSASPQDVPPPLIRARQPLMSTPPPLVPAPPPLTPATSRGPVCAEVAPDCTSPVANQTCDKRDSVQEPVVHTAATQPFEKRKRLKELLEKQAHKKTASRSKYLSTPPPLERVSGQDDKVVKDAPVPLACSEDQSECNEFSGHLSPARLPLGTRVPVVFLSIGDKKDVLFVQELLAQSYLVKMMKQMNLEVPEFKPVVDCSPGTFVAMLREEDSTWYRGVICPPRKNCEKDTAPKNDDGSSGDKLKVLLIDYGRVAHVSAASLLSLPAFFQRLPAFAIPVTLHGLPLIHLPKDFSFCGELFDAEVVINSELCQSVRLYIRNDNLCLNDTLALYAESE